MYLQARENDGEQRSNYAVVDVAVIGTNDFDPVVSTNTGSFVGQIEEDAEARTILRSPNGQNMRLIVTDQDVVSTESVITKLTIYVAHCN